ncbi:hypothetical protein ARAM_006374, partial [Aspergillus rambellii]
MAPFEIRLAFFFYIFLLAKGSPLLGDILDLSLDVDLPFPFPFCTSTTTVTLAGTRTITSTSTVASATSIITVTAPAVESTTKVRTTIYSPTEISCLRTATTFAPYRAPFGTLAAREAVHQGAMSTQSNHCPTVPPITIIVPTATAEPCTCIEGEYTTVIDTVTVAPEGISRTTTTPTHIVTATETWVHPTPTSYNALYPGLNYYQYINDYDYFNSPNGFGGGDYDTANWNGNYSYSTSGLTRNIDFESPNWPSGPARCQLPGQDTATDCSQWTVVFQGFLYAAEAGNYTVHAPTSSESSEWQDNSGFWWGGEKAYSSYANENVDGGATGN